MKSGAFRRAIGLAFLYIGCFFLLVILQFSRGPGLSERFGRLSVYAAFQKGERGGSARVPATIKLAYAGFAIEISQRHPAVLSAAGSKDRNLAPRAIETTEDGVRIRFDGGSELLATGSPERFGLAFSASGPASLTIHYSVAGRAALSSEKRAFRLDSGGDSFDLAFFSSSLDAPSGSLALNAAPGMTGRFAIAARPAASVAPASPAASQVLVAQEPKDDAAFGAEISAWRGKVWAGLSAGRYDADRLAWRSRAEAQGAPAEPRFSERALAAYLAEALDRGVYAEALAKIRPAKDRFGAELSYLTAPFLGGLSAKMNALLAADQAEAKRLSQLLSEKTPDVFVKEGLARFLFDRAPAPLAQDVLAFAATVDPERLSMRQAVGALACLVESRSYLDPDQNAFLGLAPVAERIRGAARAAPQGLFLVTDEDGSTDLRVSLVAGLRLADFGAAEGDSELVGVGQGLVEGYLGLSDDLGIAPSRIVVREGAIAERSGTILPEDVYPSLAANAYYPRQISFYRSVGPGIWAWTCVPSLTIEMGDSITTFSAAFPEGRSQYMAFFGVEAFAKIQLYNIDYNADPEFEIYDAPGYLYRKASKLLCVKMKHKHPSESIKLYY